MTNFDFFMRTDLPVARAVFQRAKVNPERAIEKVKEEYTRILSLEGKTSSYSVGLSYRGLGESEREVRSVYSGRIPGFRKKIVEIVIPSENSGDIYMHVNSMTNHLDRDRLRKIIGS